jgi:hypothetical protein
MSGNRSKIVATTRLLEVGLVPRLLDLEIAAAYVGLSAAAFQKAVIEGVYPQPLQAGGGIGTEDRSTKQLTVAPASGHRRGKPQTI